VSKSEFMRRLGEAGYAQESGCVGVLDLLARAGLPVPEGAVLTRHAHEEFLSTSGIMRDIRAAAERGDRGGAEVRRMHASPPVEGELNRAICEALIELTARTALVLSEHLNRSGLSSIPEVRDAVRDAWLSPWGLERQIAAIARGEDPPTWPVLVQRELHPQYTGWSAIEGDTLLGREGAEGRLGGTNVALYDVEPAGETNVERKGIAGLTLEAGSVLGGAVKIGWGLEDGRWYVISASSPW
jgi:hypothetical protein